MNMAPETVARLAKDFDNTVGIKGSANSAMWGG